LFSDFALIRRFSGLFIDWASSKWALSCAALPEFYLFFSAGQIGSPLFAASNKLEIDQPANAADDPAEPSAGISPQARF
jgi:hypothetical protein